MRRVVNGFVLMSSDHDFETSKRGRKFVEKEILIRLDDLTTFDQT